MHRLLPIAFAVFAPWLALSSTIAATENGHAWQQYDAAVEAAAVYRYANLRPLYPLTFDPSDGLATVTTLTDEHFVKGEQRLTEDTWVTAVPEVQNKCRQFKTYGLAMRLRELLGLQPDTKVIYFVTFKVRRDDIFRPTVNPDPTTRWPCSDPAQKTCGEVFPKDVSSSHVAFIANQMLSSYLVSPQHNEDYSYPWTRLGYTYNWRPGADRYGASEYVIRSGSLVTVTATQDYASYCSPASPVTTGQTIPQKLGG
jgi:hypothetical protein